MSVFTNKWMGICTCIALSTTTLLACSTAKNLSESPSSNSSTSSNPRADQGTSGASGNFRSVQSNNSQQATSSTYRLRIDGKDTGKSILVFTDQEGTYIPLEDVANNFGMNSAWDPKAGTFHMGYTDPIFTFHMNQTTAKHGDVNITLPARSKSFNGKAYTNVRSYRHITRSILNVDPSSKQVDVGALTPEVPNSSANAYGFPSGDPATNRYGVTSTGSANAKEIIAYAKNFLGTPYEFSAQPYPQSHRFDCSSFVQYVFEHFGMDMPRSSRVQSQLGKTVNMNNLQAGDLLFMYTPGRYGSNQIVGHVAMYIGGNQIIHTFGDPGVTVTDLNAEWSKRVLWVKRVI